jgi:hypothetical protein
LFSTKVNGTAGALTERMRIDSSGNVGIGTSSPDQTFGNRKLTVATGIGIIGTSRRWYLDATKQSDSLTIGARVSSNTADSDFVNIDSSGNVGIGTSSPGTRLDIAGGTGGSRVQFAIGSAEMAFYAVNNANTGYADATWRAASHAWYIGASERARIDSSGNFMVGTTSAYQSAKFSVVSTVDSSLTGMYAAGTGNTTGTFFNCGDDNAVKFRVFTNGNAQNTNNSYGSTSDVKLKENIVDATPKLEKLQQVRIVNYNLIGDTQKQIGVIAQELEQVFPGMVDESPDRDKDGNDLGTTTKSVKYSVFVPMLIKAIQEQQAIITALTARVAALESN